MSDIVTIAQISDVHLDPVPPIPRALFNLKRATGYLNWRRNRINIHSRTITARLLADLHQRRVDQIAVTGDLINLGLPGEMESAAAWLATVGEPDRVAVIPGNHDIYSDIGTDRGLVRWAEYMRGDAPSGSAFPYVRVRGHVALVGVNSAIETAPLQAVGRVGEDQRSRLGALLTALGREGLVRVVMIHHPPLPGQAKPAKALMDAAALQALLATAGAELVIHGHNHRSMHARIARDAAHSIPVVGIPSASARRSHNGDDLARAHIFHIARDGAIRLESRGLRIADGPVEALSVETLAGD